MPAAQSKSREINIYDEIVSESHSAAKGVCGTKIGTALLKHLAKFPDVLSTASSESIPLPHAYDIPQGDDI